MEPRSSVQFTETQFAKNKCLRKIGRTGQIRLATNFVVGELVKRATAKDGSEVQQDKIKQISLNKRTCTVHLSRLLPHRNYKKNTHTQSK